MSYCLISPNGNLITSTLESLVGTANLHGVDEDGRVMWEGYTNIDYDAQVTQTDEHGQRIYMDEGGGKFPENTLFMILEEEFDSANDLIQSGTPINEIPGIKRYADLLAEQAESR